MKNTLFTPEELKDLKEEKSKNYIIKRYIYDRLSTLIEEIVTDNLVKSKLMKELQSILVMKKSVKEITPMQKLITIGEFKKSKEDLIDEFVKLYKNDPTILNILGEKIM